MHKIFLNLNKLFGGAIFTLIALVFFITGLVLTFQSASKYFTYSETMATVTEATGFEGDSAKCQLKYAYILGPNTYPGEETADRFEEGSQFAKLEELAKQKKFSVYYDPAAPAEHTLDNRPAIAGLAFTSFSTIFLLIGIALLVSIFRKEEPGQHTRGTSQNNLPVPGYVLGTVIFFAIVTAIAMIVINVAVGHGLIRLILGLFIFADSIVLAIIVIKVLGARKKDADPFAKESSERLEGVDAGGETSDLPELFLPVAPKKAVNPEPKRLSARSLLLDLIQKRKSLAEVTQAVKQARQEEFVDENTTESEAPAPKMKQVPLTPIQDKSKGGSGAVLFLLIFAVPWCGITGLFTVFAIKPLWDRSVAAETYVEGSGVVQESRVDSHRGDESTQYKAVIRYSYEVKGKPYLSDRVSFGSGGSSSDSSGAHKTQRKYPKGAKVKLWYDPNEPSEAVLEIGSTGMSWFLLIFMQPFWMVAAGLIIGITLSFLSSNPVKRFFETDLSAFLGESLEGTLANRGFANGLNGQVRIPGWGTLAVTPEGHHLNRTRNYKKLLYAMAIGYGISFFFSIFIIAFFKPGGAGPDNCTSDTFFWILQNVTLPVMVVAVVLYLRKRSKNSAKKIDVLPRMRQIIINGTAWSYDDIQQLHLKQMRYAKGVEVNGSNVRGWSVGVMLPAGLEEPLIFLSTGQGESDEQKIVARMAHYFSQLLEKELVQCQGR